VGQAGKKAKPSSTAKRKNKWGFIRRGGGGGGTGRERTGEARGDPCSQGNKKIVVVIIEEIRLRVVEKQR